jgi:hypothetical protein
MLNSIQAQILPRVVRLSPEVREMAFYRRYFVHKNNVLFLLALAGMAIAPKRRHALVLTVPWLRSVWPVVKMDAWPPVRWPRAALRLALHVQSALLLEIALVHGSIKNRRLVL